MLDERILTKSDVNNRMQYWYSKWCNSIMRDEKEIYWSLYKSYQDLYDYWEKYNMFLEN